ncbi:contact-dependent growth inhibition system immunity protein [Paenibacillus jamilae]
MNKKIKEIYFLNQNETESEYTLDIWYNKLINKTVGEIEVVDVTRMLSQNVLINLGIKKAMDILFDDPLAGEMYEGQLLELLYSIDLNKFEDLSQLKLLLQKISAILPNLEWFDEEDQKEYRDLLINFVKKIDT